MTAWMNASTLAFALALGGLPHPPPTDAPGSLWYGFGHRIVARIAAGRLTPHTADAVRDLLGGLDMADVSSWADDIRGRRPETGSLHYVNLPLETDTYVPAKHCPDGRCIIAAIERDEGILSDSAASVPERAEALRFLVHLVADLHQPLHVADDRDRGANDRSVVLLGRAMSLHEAWDGGLLASAHPDEPAYLQHLLQVMSSLDLAALERGTVSEWAMEGHRMAAERVYRLPPNGRLDDRYVKDGLAITDLALIRAGVRLARILNDALASYTPRSRPAPRPEPGVYSDQEAAAHVGEVATIVGTVVTVHRSRAGNTYLNFGADYPRQTFSGVVINPDDPRLQGLDRLAGMRIAVKGRIRRHRGQAEIVIEGPEQIEMMP
jgi:hypothetical protein